MNKDVIYIEPENDITDIISKLKSSEQKVVALVPPKNIGVLRSAVNTKLIAKTAKTADKVAVVVTTDPSLIKLSAVAGLPVAENLQSRPKMPDELTIEELSDPTSPISIDGRTFDDGDSLEEEPEDAASSENTPKKASESAEKAAENKKRRNTAENAKSAEKAAKTPKDDEFTSEDLEKSSEKSKKSAKKSKKIPDFDKYRKWIILGIIGVAALVVFLVWAIVFAPAVKIAVDVKTTSNNFSESVSFTTDANKENLDSGVFYLESEEYAQESSTDFTATGSKDVGEKAHGTVNVSVYVNSDTYKIPAGTEFKTGDLSYTADEGATITLTNDSKCENGVSSVAKDGCLLSASVAVTATQNGDKYNISSGRSWTSGLSGNVKTITNSGSFSGGTSKTAIIVQQSNVDSAKAKLEGADESAGKEALAAKFGDDMLVIDSSYSVDASNPVSTPAVGEEVADGVTPKLTAKTTYKMYAVERAKVEEYITKKTEATLDSGQKLYSVGSPFFERFSLDGTSTKLKTTTKTGPEISEEDILERAKGQKVGEVKSILVSNFDGVSSVSVDTSFPWVKSVPTDTNKIEVELKVEE